MPGHKDWFQIGEDPWNLKFNPYPFKEMSLDDAADHTARLISEEFSNIYLGLSGGYDSEYIAKVFLRNNIPFIPIIFRDFHYNESDFALYYCRKNKLDPYVIDKSFDDPVFIKLISRLTKSLPGQEVISTINLFLALKVHKLGGRLVNGCGVSSSDPRYPCPIGQDYEFTAGDFYVEHHFGNAHPGAFFTYTPEICYAYLKNIDTTLPTQEAKAKIYNLPFRPKIRPYNMPLLFADSLNKIKAIKQTGKIPDMLCYFQEYII